VKAGPPLQSPTPRRADVCFEAAVHFDETTLVSFDAGFVEAEIVGIGTAAGGDQEDASPWRLKSRTPIQMTA